MVHHGCRVMIFKTKWVQVQVQHSVYIAKWKCNGQLGYQPECIRSLAIEGLFGTRFVYDGWFGDERLRSKKTLEFQSGRIM